MNIQQLLSHLPHEQLQGLAEEYGVAFLTPSKTSLINSIMAKYRDERFMLLLLDELSYEAKGILASLVFLTPSKNGIVRISREMMQCWNPVGSSKDFLKQIMARGFLFPSGDREETEAILPHEIRKMLLRVYSLTVPPVPVQRNVEMAERPFQELGIDAVYHLLCSFRHHPAKSTQKGDIHRRAFERWKERAHQPDLTEAEFRWVVSFCLDHELIALRGGRYRPTRRARYFFAQGIAAMRITLWKSLMRGTIFPSQEFQKALSLLHILFENRPDPSRIPVYRVSDLTDGFKQFHLLHHAADAIDSTRFRDHLRWLVFAGLLQAENSNGAQAVSFTMEGLEFLFGMKPKTAPENTVQPCMLQPTFQLLVPPGFDGETLWKLDEICEFVKRDVLTEFRLTKESILFALRSGWKKDDVLPYFEKLTGHRVPDIVRYHLEEWCGKYGQIQFRKVMVLECKSAELADEIAHIPGVGEFLLERIGDRFYLADEEHARAMYQQLMDFGYEPAVFKKNEVENTDEPIR